MRNKILLNPGPTNTRFWTKVKQWIGSDQCHRENGFQDRLNQVQETLRKEVYPQKYGRVAIMAGSGTTAMEAMISSLVSDGVLLIVAGKYGVRASEIMQTYNIEHSIVKSCSIDDLKTNEAVTRVYFVENETSSGEKYSLERMCKLYPNAKFYLDSTSAFGASDYKKYSHRIIALCCCSNKCLQSTPGLGIVIWDGIESCLNKSYFGDLSKYGIDRLPFTLPTQSLYALEEALKHSLSNREAFDSRAARLIKDFKRLGIKCLSSVPCNSIIGFKHPTMNYEQLRGFLSLHGLVIYSGIEGIENSFRVSTMSTLFDRKYDSIIAYFEKSVRRRNV